MANKEKEGKNKGAKKGVMAIITAILVPIMIVVLIAGSFFAIITAIFEFIMDITTNIILGIIDLFKNPVDWVREKWSAFNNWLGEVVGADVEFDAYEYENKRIDPTVVITHEDFEEMKIELEKMINRNAAGLDDFTLKKMLLAYYKGLYLTDTAVLMELTPEDLAITNDQYLEYFDVKYQKDGVWENIAAGALAGAGVGGFIGSAPGALLGAVAGAIGGLVQTEDTVRIILGNESKENLNNTYKTQVTPFEIVGGDNEKNKGTDGALYIETIGTVEIFAACSSCERGNDSPDCESCKKIIYYQEDVLDNIYEKHYLNLLTTNPDFAASTLEYLEKCYTYTEDGIKMYSTRTEESVEKTWEYKDETDKANRIENPIEWVGSWFDNSTQSRERNLTPTTVYPVTAQNIEFSTKIAEYATPAEFLINLLEITASNDYVNAFIERLVDTNYIKLKLYKTGNNIITEEAEIKNRETLIVAENHTYTAEVIEKDPEGWDSWIAVEKGDFKELLSGVSADGTLIVDVYGLSDSCDYKIRIWYNDEYVKDVIFKPREHSSYGTGTNKYHQVTVEGMIPGLGQVSDKSQVRETITTTTATTQYDIAISKIKTWYGTYIPKNSVKQTLIIENLQKVGASTKRIELLHDDNWNSLDHVNMLNKLVEVESNIKEVELGDTFDSVNNPTILNVKSLDTIENTYNTNKANEEFEGYTEDECLNVQFNYVLQYTKDGKTVDNNFSNNYQIKRMDYVDRERKKTTIYITNKLELQEGMSNGTVTVTDNFNDFLSLLSNRVGEYKNRSEYTSDYGYHYEQNYIPTSSIGKLVKYKDLYDSETAVGNLLVNGAEMLYSLLEQSERTQGLVNVMKYVLYQYSSGNYSVRDWDFNIYQDDEWISTMVTQN